MSSDVRSDAATATVIANARGSASAKLKRVRFESMWLAAGMCAPARWNFDGTRRVASEFDSIGASGHESPRTRCMVTSGVAGRKRGESGKRGRTRGEKRGRTLGIRFGKCRAWEGPTPAARL
jgi:hypothetical protein